MLALGLVARIPSPASGTAQVTTRRLAGADRYGTARAIAAAAFPSGTSFAILAGGDQFADALSANYAAGISPQAPMLLTPPDQLSDQTLGALQDLKVQGVVIVGGPASVGAAVEKKLAQSGFQTRRLAGGNRYETSNVVDEAFGSQSVGTLNNDKTAIVASGESFPDALAAGPMAFARHFPVVLTTSSSLAPEAAKSLHDLAIKRAIIVGGTAAVSSDVEAKLTAGGVAIQRLSGPNRQATATAVANFELASLGFSGARVALARGDAFADSLGGAALAGRAASTGSTVVLTGGPDSLSAEARGFLQQDNGALSSIDVLGGVAAVSDQVVTEGVAAATCGSPGSSSSSSTTPAANSTTSTSSTSPSSTTTSTTGPGSSSTSGMTCTPPSSTTTAPASSSSSTSSTPTSTSSSTTTTTTSSSSTSSSTTTTTTGGTTTTTMATTTTMSLLPVCPFPAPLCTK